MSDLSAYLSFNVVLDFQAGKIKVIDNSAYPTGVAAGITGIINVVQPDKVTLMGNWNTPDAVYNNGVLQGQVELRKDSKNNPQKGTYTVTYQIDHPSYSPTQKTVTFELDYTPVPLVITQNFDVFTPSLKVQDDTNYSQSNFNAPTLTRTWAAQIGSIGSIAGNQQILDLIDNGHYYDAAYQITLTANLTYQHSTYTFLSVVDTLSLTINPTANTPPTFTTLQGYLKTLKDNLDSSQSCDDSLKKDFEYASSVLEQIQYRICSGNTNNLYSQIQDFLNVYHGHVTVAYTNTNTPLATYSTADCNCGGTGGSNDARISATDINNWNQAFTAIAPDDIYFKVGSEPTGWTTTGSTIQSNSLINWRVRLTVNDLVVPNVNLGAMYFSKGKSSDTITLYADTLSANDVIHIERY